MRTIPTKETLNTELKSDRKGLSDSALIESVVGLANTNGGDLFLGVEDDGTISGILPKHGDTVGLVALVANRTIPSLRINAEIIEVQGKKVIKITVPKSRSIISTAEGKMLRRRLKQDGTPENTPIYPFEINSRLAELNLLDFSAQILAGASTDDFDPNERLRLRDIIKLRKGDDSLLDLTDEELDKALRFVKEENGSLYPTITGMLLIGKEVKIKELMPTAESGFQVLEGTQIRVNEHFFKPLLSTFEIFEKYMKAWNPEREMESGLFRIPIPEFSEKAFREGLVNAFCHRDYTQLGTTRVAINDEGLTISNPGGFVEGVNLHNLLTVEPHGRNPALADSLKRIGLAERTGRGIDRIFEGSIVYGRPLPDYSESTEREVKLFIPRAEPDVAFAKMISDEEQRTGHSLPINSLLILSTLQRQRRLSLSELAASIGISEARTRSAVETLIENGLVEAIETGKYRTYILSAQVYKQQNNIMGYVRQTAKNYFKDEELICNLAQQKGHITRKEVMDLLHVNSPRAYYLLKQISKKGRLIPEGFGRAARYKFKQ